MNELGKRRCVKCGNGEFKVLAYVSPYGTGYQLVCSKCEETLIEVVVCDKCRKKLSEREAKEYLQRYKDSHFNIHSVLCAGCRRVHDSEGQSRLF